MAEEEKIERVRLEKISARAFEHPADRAALAALREPNDFISAQLEQLKEKREKAMKTLEPVCDGSPTVAQGAFYLFVAVDHLLTGSDGKPGSSAELALWLLNEKGVAVVPGSDFGIEGEGYIRLSYSTDMVTLANGLDRLLSGLDQLR